LLWSDLSMLLSPGTLLRLRTPINFTAALCHNRFFEDIQYHCENLMGKITFADTTYQASSIWRFIFNKYLKWCWMFPPSLRNSHIRVPARNIYNSNTFSCSFSHCPSARYVSAANAVCKSTYFYDLASKRK
jgi:hypothetical protein